MKKLTISMNHGDDLEKIGISILTGERDNTMTGRLLCDLSAKGAKLIKSYFSLSDGVAGSKPFESNWNQKVGDDDALYSIMLPRELFKPLAIFALITMPDVECVYASESAVWSDDDSLWKDIDNSWDYALIKATEELGDGDMRVSKRAQELMPAFYLKIERWRGIAGKPVHNVHAMSGRA